jgi:hypothetical protein
MKTAKASELRSLPQQVRALIAEGVYSLYELHSDLPRYVLLTAQGDYYFLAESGEVVPPPMHVRSLADVHLGSPVTVSGDPGSPRLHVSSILLA